MLNTYCLPPVRWTHFSGNTCKLFLLEAKVWCADLLHKFLSSVEILTDISRCTMCIISVGHVKQVIPNPEVGDKNRVYYIDLAKTG